MEWWKKLRKMRGNRKAWDIAHEAGMAESQYSRYESGHYPDIKISTLERLAKGLGCSVKDFFEDEKKPIREIREVTREEARIISVWRGLPKKLRFALDELSKFLKSENLDMEFFEKGGDTSPRTRKKGKV